MIAQLIKGVSPDLANAYAESYKDTGLKYKFMVSEINDSKRSFRQFTDCTEAAESVGFADHPNNESNTYTIFLNRVDGSTFALEESDITALTEFEGNEVAFKFFQKIVIRCNEISEDMHITRYPKVYGFGPSAEEDAEYEKRQLKRRLAEEIEDREHIAEELNKSQSECEELLAQLKVERKTARDIAMLFIQNMSPAQFQERLLFGESDRLKLPKFQRAVEGDEDYIDKTTALAGTDDRISKKKIERYATNTAINFGFNYREFLRFMSEEEFIKLCYYERDLK